MSSKSVMHARAHLHARPDIFHYVCSIFCLQGVHIYFVHVFFTMYRFLSVSMHCSIFAQVASFTLLFQISSQELERNGFLEANRPEVDVEVDLTRPSCSGAVNISGPDGVSGLRSGDEAATCALRIPVLHGARSGSRIVGVPVSSEHALNFLFLLSSGGVVLLPLRLFVLLSAAVRRCALSFFRCSSSCVPRASARS